MRILLVAALVLSSNVALSQSRTITQEHIGCKREEISDRLTKFAVQGDQEAFKKLLIAAMVAGECVRWEKGKQVFVEKSGWTVSCLRPAGEVQCYWTPVEATR